MASNILLFFAPPHMKLSPGAPGRRSGRLPWEKGERRTRGLPQGRPYCPDEYTHTHTDRGPLGAPTGTWGYLAVWATTALWACGGVQYMRRGKK